MSPDRINFPQKILVLTDNRAGTNNQSIALAEEVGDYDIFKIEHSFLGKLPNKFFSNSWSRISKESATKLQEKLQNDGFPSFIICGGRKLALIARMIKEQSNFSSKIIQIMQPQLPINNFDIVIIPDHDNFKYRNDKRVIFSVGALNKVNKKNLALEKEKFTDSLGKISKKKITLLLGGKSRGVGFGKTQALDLIKFIDKVAKRENAKILILNSRRTEAKINKIFKNNLNCDYEFFDWRQYQNSENNPYLAVLAYSDKLIVSSDSISMISECCSTQKPTYVFNCDKLPSKKHERFLQYMLRNIFVKKLNTNKSFLKEFEPKKLQETKRIASIIKFKYLKNDPID